jgi:hypothetical protein
MFFANNAMFQLLKFEKKIFIYNILCQKLQKEEVYNV